MLDGIAYALRRPPQPPKGRDGEFPRQIRVSRGGGGFARAAHRFARAAQGEQVPFRPWQPALTGLPLLHTGLQLVPTGSQLVPAGFHGPHSLSTVLLPPPGCRTHPGHCVKTRGHRLKTRERETKTGRRKPRSDRREPQSGRREP